MDRLCWYCFNIVPEGQGEQVSPDVPPEADWICARCAGPKPVNKPSIVEYLRDKNATKT